MSNKLILLFIVGLVWITGCSVQEVKPRLSGNLPEKFSKVSEADSNVANLTWNYFFKDSLLVQLIDTALLYNPDLQIAMQRVEIARADVKAAKGALLPTATVGPALGIRRFGLYTMDGAGNIATEMTPGNIVPIDLPDLYLGAQASWEADVWGKLRAQKKSAQARFLSTIEGVHLLKSSLVAEIASSYYELIAADYELEVIRQTILNEQQALDVILLQKEAGRANELAVEQFEAQLIDTRAMESMTEQKIVELENRINFLIGRFPQPISRLREVLYDSSNTELPVGLPSALLLNRPDIRQAEQDIQASKLDVKVARKAFYPMFNLSASYGVQAFHSSLLFTTPASIAYTALSNLFTPVLNRHSLKARLLAANSRQVQAVYQYQQTLLRGFTEVQTELSNQQNLGKVRAYKQAQSQILTQSVSTSRDLYRTARASYVEVLFAQQHALKANLELVNAVKNLRISTVNLYRALGGGWK